MVTRRFGFTIEVDIHGMTVTEAKRELEKLLNSCDNTITEIDVIHGYTGGHALLDLVRRDLKHTRIVSRMLSLNQGVTSIKIRPKQL